MCTMCNVTFDTPDYTRLTLTQIFLCFCVCVFLRVNFNLIFKAFSYTTKGPNDALLQAIDDTLTS